MLALAEMFAYFETKDLSKDSLFLLQVRGIISKL